jgi:hypothetical protein
MDRESSFSNTSMVSTNNAEAIDVTLFVEDFKALGAVHDEEDKDDANLDRPDGDEAAHHGPDDDDR